MARDTDDVRVESALAHRKRLRQALLLGAVGQRRDIDDGLKAMIISVVLAGVACAGCVGYSFVAHMLAQAKASASPAITQPVVTASANIPANAEPTAVPTVTTTMITVPTNTGR